MEAASPVPPPLRTVGISTTVAAEEESPGGAMSALRVIDQIVIPALVVFLLIGSLAAALLGVALLLRSAAALRFIARMNRWVSTRRALKPLEIPRSVETLTASRSRPWLGALVVIGAAAALYLLLTRMETIGSRSASALELKRWLSITLPLLTLKWFLVAGSAFAIVAGVMMVAFPRAWRALEERMNRWYSTRRLVPAGSDDMRMPLEALVEAHPRAAGAIIVVASLIVALSMAGLLALR